MNRIQAKKWEKEIVFWANGGDLWSYEKERNLWFTYTTLLFTGDIYVIEDKHFMARKAHALGEPLEYRYPGDEWDSINDPIWNDECEYRVKAKAWHDNIPEKGVICWVWDKEEDKKRFAAIIVEYEASKYVSNISSRWKYAEPVTKEDLLEDKASE